MRSCGLASLPSAGQALRLETQRRADVVRGVQRHLETDFLLPQGTSLHLFSLRPSTPWMRPTHIMEGHPLCSKSTDLNVNHV